MKVGKIRENIWKRSVRKEIKKHSFDTCGIGVGSDSVMLDHSGRTCVTENCLVPFCRQMGTLAVYQAVSAAAGSLSTPESIIISLMLDGRSGEDFLKHVAKSAYETAEKCGVTIAGFDTHILQGLKKPFITAQAIGRDAMLLPGAGADEDIIVTGYVGLSGSIVMADSRMDQLVPYYPRDYIEGIFNFEKLLSAAEQVEIIKHYAPTSVRAVAEGGIFRSLWELAEKSGVGMDVELKNIPLMQETVEICNYLDYNPYKLYSAGCFLITVKDAGPVIEELESHGIKATLIGRTNSSNDKLLINEDEKTFITQPDQDEVYGVI